MRDENTLEVLEFDEDAAAVRVVGTCTHEAGELWDLAPAPTDESLLLTVYNSHSGARRRPPLSVQRAQRLARAPYFAGAGPRVRASAPRRAGAAKAGTGCHAASLWRLDASAGRATRTLPSLRTHRARAPRCTRCQLNLAERVALRACVALRRRACSLQRMADVPVGGASVKRCVVARPASTSALPLLQAPDTVATHGTRL